MQSEAEILSIAIDAVIDTQWSPPGRPPIVEQIVARAPGVSADRAAKLEQEARSIAKDAFALAWRAWHGEMTEQEGRAELGRRYPHIAPSTCDNLWSKGGYNAWHG